MIVPALGKYWSERLLVGAIDFPNMRQPKGVTQAFDNAHCSIQGAWQQFGPLISGDCLPIVEDCGRGNPPLMTIDGHTMSVGSIEYAAMLSQFWPVRNVLEIGGGYGGLAHAGLMMGVEKWTIVDIPSTGRCSRYYLEPWGSRVKIITPDELEANWPAPSLVVQTRGFMEMSTAELGFYFGVIQERLRPGDRFFTINRLRKETYFPDYPFDARWKVLKAALWPEGASGFPMLLLERTADERPDVQHALKGFGG